MTWRNLISINVPYTLASHEDSFFSCCSTQIWFSDNCTNIVLLLHHPSWPMWRGDRLFASCVTGLQPFLHLLGWISKWEQRAAGRGPEIFGGPKGSRLTHWLDRHSEVATTKHLTVTDCVMSMTDWLSEWVSEWMTEWLKKLHQWSMDKALEQDNEKHKVLHIATFSQKEQSRHRS